MASPFAELLAQRVRFGRQVRNLRIALRLSQAALAAEAGLTLARTSKLERGFVVPRQAEAAALADAIATATHEALAEATPPVRASSERAGA